MKRAVSLILVFAMLFSLAGCSLFSDKSLVYIDKTHTVNDPQGLSYETRIVLNNTKFAESIESYVNAAAYPDNMMYDEEGNMVGMYNYDETTGLASGWTNLQDGTYTAFPEGEEVDLGKPDASKMIDIPGDVILGCVVYGSKAKATDAYFYLFLSDAGAKDVVKTNMASLYGMEFKEDSDTVLSFHQDEATIDAEFQAMIDEGLSVMSKDAAAYADSLKSMYMVKEYTGESAYKPYANITDPTDIEFDQRVILAGTGEYAILEQYIDDLSVMTDVVYGKDGKTVGHYTYYEAPNKASGDNLESYLTENHYSNVTRVADTAVMTYITGKELEDTITAYKGYNVMKDDSVDEYVRFIEESFFSVVCE